MDTSREISNVGLGQFLKEQNEKCKRFEEEAAFAKRNISAWSFPSSCAASFDGLLCWPRTNASRTARLSCPPSSILSYESHEQEREATASKNCLVNGEWYRNEEGVSWSNYSLCGSTIYVGMFDTSDDDSLSSHGYETPTGSPLLDVWLPVIKIVSQIGYASSLVILFVAMLVFSSLRRLRNSRNRLHMHLFSSFIMRASMALLKNGITVNGIGLAWDITVIDGKTSIAVERNTWLCKAITSAWQYFIVANYTWISMEGLYLHNLVFFALCSDTGTNIVPYVILGWGLPGLVVVPWIIVRATVENTLCWTTHDNPSLFLIVRIPIMLSILFNFFLFLNMARVLLNKLKTSVHLQRKRMQYSRWAKSTLILVPLFGAHYTLFLGLSYHDNRQVELVWLFFDQLFASFQGTLVALLYCLLNGEVRTEVRRAWREHRWREYIHSSLVPRRCEISMRYTSECEHDERRRRQYRNSDETRTSANSFVL